MKIDLENAPLSTDEITVKREALEKKISDIEKRKSKFCFKPFYFALLALTIFIIIMSQYDLIVNVGISAALGLSVGVLLGLFIVTSLRITSFSTATILFYILSAILMIGFTFISVIEGAEMPIKLGFGIGVVSGIIGSIAYSIWYEIQRDGYRGSKNSIKFAISRFSELDPKTQSGEYIALAKWVDNDEVVKHYLKQIADLKRKPTLGEYQAILVWAENKTEREQKLQEEKQAQEVIHKLGFSEIKGEHCV